ncbi:13595_t:CDS:1, partial [Funneliformis geosporum]
QSTGKCKSEKEDMKFFISSKDNDRIIKLSIGPYDDRIILGSNDIDCDIDDVECEIDDVS